MEKLGFEYAAPESVGIGSAWIRRFMERLEECDLPMHSFILMREGKIVAESYYAPYREDTLHRMFSVTKSFVSVAIGCLEEEGKLSLDDPIIRYFPEKLPEGELHPYLSAMTIRDMLKMSSCHAATTYKFAGVMDWVGSFFTAVPTHAPGTVFSYDTSATHTLCALAEKLSGMPLLDYLRGRFLDAIGFSSSAYVMQAPGGESYGGSGLMATPMDLLRFAYVVSREGCVGGRQLLPAAYLREAVKWQIDTYGKSASWEEMQGYGYQFWRTTRGGWRCYGMGGQFACYYPEKDLFFVTTADTQGRQGGNQLIFDAFHQEIYDKIGAEPVQSVSGLQEFLASRVIVHIEGAGDSPILPEINGVWYDLDASRSGFKRVALQVSSDRGALLWENADGVHELSFGIGANVTTAFPGYGFRAAVSGAFRGESTFLIRANIIDECIGNVTIQLGYNGDRVTMFMRKVEETMFAEFDGFISGRRSADA